MGVHTGPYIEDRSLQRGPSPLPCPVGGVHLIRDIFEVYATVAVLGIHGAITLASMQAPTVPTSDSDIQCARLKLARYNKNEQGYKNLPEAMLAPMVRVRIISCRLS